MFFKEFQTWLRENDILDISDVSTITIKSYLVYCKKERGNNPNTINNKLKNLRALFNHLVENEYISKNPCYKVSSRRQIIRLRYSQTCILNRCYDTIDD
ncbi:phage integrase SAM-like domain-containing protein [Lysinibacillus parviboronicapiens]|uniref:phage integrase SAM-like domain-containing protein n=1 Tax=Lysinibacillus parviboronicapiens TaxID=436516 RepID=UPI000D36379B